MYFLFSGEGATDFGTGSFNDQICEGDNYAYGPMALIVDQIVKHRHGYSLVESECYGFVSKQALSIKAKSVKPAKAGMRLPGRKNAKETSYFFRNARALALWAKHVGTGRNGDVVAVLFRDCDGTASSNRGLWEDKWKSMENGFTEENFHRGVPMIPKPKSEAWLLCALKESPYTNCATLEDRTSSEKAKLGLKKELRELLQGEMSRATLCAMLAQRTIDAARISMPSFDRFRNRLQKVIST